MHSHSFNYPSHYWKDTVRWMVEQRANYDNDTIKAKAIKQNETL